MKVGKEAYTKLESGAELHRIHPSAFGSTQFNGTVFGSARFSPIRNSDGDIIPTIYAGESFECAVCEIILRCPDIPFPGGAFPSVPTIVFPTDYRDRRHSCLVTRADLNLIDVRTAGQRKIGLDHNLLLAGPTSTYPVTRSWAEKIHASCPGAQGLYYTSYQNGPAFALVLFGDRIPDDALEEISWRNVADAPCHEEIKAIAEALSIEYEDV